MLKRWNDIIVFDSASTYQKEGYYNIDDRGIKYQHSDKVNPR